MCLLYLIRQFDRILAVKITVFYICFYAGLASFFLASLKIAMTINIVDDRPKWTLDNSLITSNPGVGFRPTPDQDKNVESTLIWINKASEVNTSYWVQELETFIAGKESDKSICLDLLY